VSGLRRRVAGHSLLSRHTKYMPPGETLQRVFGVSELTDKLRLDYLVLKAVKAEDGR
jgi:hypothetical protein